MKTYLVKIVDTEWSDATQIKAIGFHSAVLNFLCNYLGRDSLKNHQLKVSVLYTATEEVVDFDAEIKTSPEGAVFINIDKVEP